MRAKEYLQSIRSLDAKINNKINQLDEVRSKLTSVSSTSTGDERVQTSISLGSKTESLIIKLEVLSEEINGDIDRYVGEKNKAINLVNCLENKTYIEILSFRYFEGRTWEEIAVKMGYGYRHTLRIHGQALVEFQKVLDTD